MVCPEKVLLECDSSESPYSPVTVSRPYLHVYKHSNELEEISVINLNGINIECNPEMEALLGVSLSDGMCSS